MMIQGSSVSAVLLRDTSAADRFWYWRGASGRRYIHSVYPADACPPLPGAVYVSVKRTGQLRTALSCGRFPKAWVPRWEQAFQAILDDADEIHVHLLAASEAEAQAVWNDLRAALKAEETQPAGMAA